MGKIPSYNTISDWVKKCGLDVYRSSGEVYKKQDYAQVVDESMMIGSEKLLVTLGIPSAHQGRALDHGDASVLDISVSNSWTGEGVKARLQEAARKVGHQPRYVVSDNASVMNKAIRLSGINHHRDISHTLGMYLERTYKHATDFKQYVKSMTEVKFKHNMKVSAYLLPPTQRTVARFINLSGWVKWSAGMLKIYHTLSPQEKAIFCFIPANASLIEELEQVTNCVQSIEKTCKHQGLSIASFAQCRQHIERHLFSGNERMSKLADNMLCFLRSEVALLESDKEVRNNSSDIIESVFGTYKARKSPNKLYGVTPFVLFIPMYTQLKRTKDAKRFGFKDRLQRVRLRDIENWRRNNLSPNLVSKRTKTLRNTG